MTFYFHVAKLCKVLFEKKDLLKDADSKTNAGAQLRGIVKQSKLHSLYVFLQVFKKYILLDFYKLLFSVLIN